MALNKKIFDGKTLAILTGGGDSPSLNASIEAIKCKAAVLGFKVIGIRKGWKGLLGDGDVVDLSGQPYDGWYGGTALRTTRTNPFPTLNNPIDRTDEILRNIKRYGINVLVTIGGDDTTNVSKKMFEQFNLPIIAFPNTINNNIRTKTIHNYNGEELEAAMSTGFPSAAKAVAEFTSRICTTAESHSRIIVLEVPGRNTGWLTGAAMVGGAEISLIPEVPIQSDMKEAFFESVVKVYNSIKKKFLVVAVAEGTQWYNDKTGKLEICYLNNDVDEFGNRRFGGIGNLVSSEIEKKTGIQSRTQVLGYYARSGECRKYDKRLCGLLADKMIDLLLREDFGKMIVLNKLSTYQEIEEYNTATIPLKECERISVPDYYYETDIFHFNEKFYDYMSYFVERPKGIYFNYNFPKVYPAI